MNGGAARWPRVVACVPARNASGFIATTLAALAAQDYPNLEVLVSDDASGDGTVEICQRAVGNSDRFRVISQSRRLGWVDNTNWLLVEARTTAEYLFVLPHDDLVHQTYVSRLVRALEANPNSVLAFSDTVHVFCGPGRPRLPVIAAYDRLDGITDRMERARRAANYQLDLVRYRSLNVLTVAFRGLFRSRAVDQVGGMRKNLAGEFGADWAWLLRLALLGEFVRVPEVLVRKRRYSSSLSSSWQYSPIDRVGEWSGCIAAVRRAGLPVREELMVHRRLIAAACLALAHTLKRSLRDAA